MFADRVCNTTLQDSTLFSEARAFHGRTFHQWGLIVSIAFGGGAVLFSAVLLFLHCAWSDNLRQRKYIIRILFMVPLYAVVSFLSYYYYLHAIYYETIRDCYEAYALANFYWLLLAYCGETKADQKDFLVSAPMRDNWTWPIGTFQRCLHRQGKPPPKRWLRIIHLGIFQYCAIRVTCTFVSCITQYYGVYCEKSNSMYFAHVYVEVFEAIGVTVAMYCLIDLYLELRIKKRSSATYSADTSLETYTQGARGNDAIPKTGAQQGARSLHRVDTSGESSETDYNRFKSEKQPAVSTGTGLFVGHRVEAKVASIKLVIFFSFWQALVVSMLLTYGAFKPSAKIGYNDFQVGLPAMLICIEMCLFSILHFYAFSFLEPMPTEHPSTTAATYKSDAIPGARWLRETSRSRALRHRPARILYSVCEAANPFDVLRAMRECLESLVQLVKWAWGSCTHYKTWEYQKSPSEEHVAGVGRTI